MPQRNSDRLKRRIAQLACEARGSRPRHEIYDAPGGPSRSAYIHFEQEATWPRVGTLRKIEKALGWRDGIITEVLSRGMDPDELTLAVLRDRPDEGMLAASGRAPGMVGKVTVSTLDEGRELLDEFSLVPGDSPAKGPVVHSVHPVLASFSDYELAKELAIRMAAKSTGASSD